MLGHCTRMTYICEQFSKFDVPTSSVPFGEGVGEFTKYSSWQLQWWSSCGTSFWTSIPKSHEEEHQRESEPVDMSVVSKEEDGNAGGIYVTKHVQRKMFTMCQFWCTRQWGQCVCYPDVFGARSGPLSGSERTDV